MLKQKWNMNILIKQGCPIYSLLKFQNTLNYCSLVDKFQEKKIVAYPIHLRDNDKNKNLLLTEHPKLPTFSQSCNAPAASFYNLD